MTSVQILEKANNKAVFFFSPLTSLRKMYTLISVPATQFTTDHIS